MKYAMTLLVQNEAQTEREQERQKEFLGIVKQILLLPLTGGWSLLKYFRNRMTGG